MENIEFLFDKHSYWYRKSIRIEIEYKAKIEIRFASGLYLWTRFSINDKTSEFLKSSNNIRSYLELINTLLDGSDIRFDHGGYYAIGIELNNGNDIEVKFQAGLSDIWTAIKINGYEMRWIHYPAEIKPFFDAINADDRKKLAFMERLAASGLNPLKHLNFDEKKLDRAIKMSEKMKGNGNSAGAYEIIQEYEAAYGDFHSEGNRIWKIDGTTFFTKRDGYSGNSWYDSINFAACDDNENCYRSDVRKSAIGKMLVQKRITSTMRKKLQEGYIVDHERFMSYAGAFLDSKDLNMIPDWLTVEMVERKLAEM